MNVHGAIVSPVSLETPHRGRPIGCRGSAVPHFTARRVALGFGVFAIALQLTKRGLPTSLQAVSGWEQGDYLPTPDRIEALAEILHVSEDACECMFYGAVAHA